MRDGQPPEGKTSNMSLSEIGFALIVGIFVMVLLQVLDVLPH